LLALRRSHSAWIVVGVVVATKACDTGAYFTGRAVGRHKLIPWLSPGKTWEGLIGGVALATAVGLALAAASRLGDLAVSLFKRGAGMKDSSTMLPGLGGVLDVLDSPLMVAPVAYWILTLALSNSVPGYGP
ncbi:MAG: phosphatidate cytidylyltransferase, partial [Planctomycetota bacterium]